MLVFDITEEPTGKCYADLVRCGLDYCDGFLLVVRDMREICEECNLLLGQLSGYLVAREEQQSWPGTELLTGSAQVLRYKLTAGSAKQLTAAVGKLYQWLHPERPEDLCLLRPNGDAWLTTISHERDAYLTLREGEDRAIKVQVPGLAIRRSTAYQ